MAKGLLWCPGCGEEITSLLGVYDGRVWTCGNCGLATKAGEAATAMRSVIVDGNNGGWLRVDAPEGGDVVQYRFGSCDQAHAWPLNTARAISRGLIAATGRLLYVEDAP